MLQVAKPYSRGLTGLARGTLATNAKCSGAELERAEVWAGLGLTPFTL